MGTGAPSPRRRSSSPSSRAGRRRSPSSSTHRASRAAPSWPSRSCPRAGPRWPRTPTSTTGGQTVLFPRIGTTATDAEDGSHEAAADGDVTITDEVAYENLVPGKEYELTGTLMDRETGEAVTGADGRAVTSTTRLTPESGSGTAEVTFSFDGSALAGRTVVAFETLSLSGKGVRRARGPLGPGPDGDVPGHPHDRLRRLRRRQGHRRGAGAEGHGHRGVLEPRSRRHLQADGQARGPRLRQGARDRGGGDRARVGHRHRGGRVRRGRLRPRGREPRLHGGALARRQGGRRARGPLRRGGRP
jgi:hypothetical protein